MEADGQPLHRDVQLKDLLGVRVLHIVGEREHIAKSGLKSVTAHLVGQPGENLGPAKEKGQIRVEWNAGLSRIARRVLDKAFLNELDERRTGRTGDGPRML
jgi:hypothetical protein